MKLKTNVLAFVLLLVPYALYPEAFRYSREEIGSLLNGSDVIESQVCLDGKWLRGTSLLETLPLMEDVYLMTIRTESTETRLQKDDLAEFWSEAYWIHNGATLDLIIEGKFYKGIKEIEFIGTPMAGDELEIWLSWEGIGELKEEINRFARRHNLKVRTLEVPHPEAKLVSVVRARGDVPDLVMLQSSSVESLVESRAIQSLDYLQLPDLMEQGRRAFTLDDRLWGVPFYYDTQVIFYNKSLIPDRPDEDWTLEEMERLAGTLTSRGIHPLAWNAYSSNWLIPFQMSYGKETLLNPDGTITVDDEPTRRALDYILGIVDEGLLTPMERDAMDALFIQGKIGMIMSGSYAIPYFESLGLDFSVLPYPRNGETGRDVSPLLDFKAFCMTRQTHAPLIARRIMQYLVSAGVQQRFCPSQAKLPARGDVLALPGISYGYLDILEESADTGTVVPPQNVYSIYKNNMWKLLRFALSGKMSVSQILEQGQTLMNNTQNTE